jgi:hypothetical protein
MDAFDSDGFKKSLLYLVDVLGVAWGLTYFVIGAIASFTINSIDFWGSVAYLFSNFLLPLPITILAVWFPKAAGKALLLCAAVTAGVVIELSGITSLAFDFRKGYILTHLLFGVAYILLGAGGPVIVPEE